MPSKRAEVKEYIDELKSKKCIYERIFKDVQEYVRPNSKDFYNTNTAGLERTDRIYTDAPGYFSEVASSGIDAYLTNSADRYFEYQHSNNEINENSEAQRHMELMANAVYTMRHQSSSGFNMAKSMFYYDAFTFGTAIMQRWWNKKDGGIKYKTRDLADCFIDTNDEGFVDVVALRVIYNKRQAIQRFGKDTPKKIMDSKNNTDPFEFFYLVKPNMDYDRLKLGNSGFKYSTHWICSNDNDFMLTKGLNIFPFLVTRWRTLGEEIYGRSPIIDNIQTIRVLNEMWKDVLEAADFAIKPPLQVVEEAIIGRWNWHPNEIINVQSNLGEEAIRPINVNGSIPVNEKMIAILTDQLSKSLYNDVFSLPDYAGRDRVTQSEIMRDSTYKLRRIAGLNSRMESEFLDPLNRGDYELIIENQNEKDPIIPAAPKILENQKLKINYISPTAMAQKGMKAMNGMQFLQAMAPLIQNDPRLLSGIDMPGLFQDSALAFNVSRKRIKTEEQLEAEKAEMQQQQQTAQLIQAAPDLSKSIKDLSQASAIAAESGLSIGQTPDQGLYL